MPSNLQPPTPILDAAKAELEQEAVTVPSVPENTTQVGFVADKDDMGVVAEGDQQLGHGMEVVEQASWWKGKGWNIGAWFRWKK